MMKKETKQLVATKSYERLYENDPWKEFFNAKKMQDVREMLRQVAQVLQFCLTRSVVHRDVSLENILVKQWDKIRVVLSDFNYRKVMAHGHQYQGLENVCLYTDRASDKTFTAPALGIASR